MKKRFLILSVLLFLPVVLHIKKGDWSGDFWEHAAVVHELGAAPIHPKHPFTGLDTPHQFFSPYSLSLGLISRFANLTSIQALASAGVFNLILLLLSLRLFISSLSAAGFTEASDTDATCFYLLLLMLFFWGESPWFWSGFFHIEVFPFVMPYPSTFILAIVLFCFSIYIRLVRGGSKTWYLAILGLSSITVLVHPLTAIFLFVGLSALCVCLSGRISVLLLLWGILLLSFVPVALWPYYPFFQLISVESAVLDQSNAGIMYVSVFQRIFPSLAGLPLLWIRLKTNQRDPLPWIFLGLLLVYMYAGISKHWVIGRVITNMVLLLHLSIAIFLARLESDLRERRTVSIWKKGFGASIGFLFSICFLMHLPALKDHVTGYATGQYELSFLPGYVRHYDTVLSTLRNSSQIPAFEGKVVAAPYPMLFVRDANERKAALVKFFEETTSAEEQAKILRKYKAGFLLLDTNKTKHWRSLLLNFENSGKVVYRGNHIILIKLDQRRLESSTEVRE